MSERKKVKLGEISSYVKDKIPITSTDESLYVSTDSMLKDKGGIIPPESIPGSGSITLYRHGDILVSNIRPYFKKIWFANRVGGCSNDVIVFRAKKEIDPRYLYYILSEDTFFEHMMAGANGTKMPRGNKKLILSYTFTLPSTTTQHRIATILSRYDSLIENYQKQIKLLEEAAQRLYKEWFVDLRFPGHESTKIVDGVPEGWEKKPLGSIVQKSIGGGWGKESRQGSYDKSAYVVRGTDISKLKNGSPDDIPFRYHTDSNLKERVLSDGDIIFEVSGGSEKEPVGRMYYITQQILDFYKERVICASFCKKVSFGDKNSSLLAYYAMQYCRESGDMKKYEKDSAGNIINFAWSTFLDDFIVLVPDKLILGSFCERVQAIINNLVNISLQIRLLVEARDRLLPKLMSGEIEIK